MTTARNVVNLALIGFMGTGKSSVGRLVAERLRFDFLDTDELIETRAGQSIAEISPKTANPPFGNWNTDSSGNSPFSHPQRNRHRRRLAREPGQSG